MNLMSKKQAKEFASKWLFTWTGNDPEKLLSYIHRCPHHGLHVLKLGIGRDIAP